jgi:hypothetical protein
MHIVPTSPATQAAEVPHVFGFGKLMIVVGVVLIEMRSKLVQFLWYFGARQNPVVILVGVGKVERRFRRILRDGALGGDGT